MKEIRTEIRIEASQAAVWEVLTGFAAYPEWNPFLIEVRAELAPGARLQMRVRGRRRTLAADGEVLAVVRERELRWVGPASPLLRRLVRGEHYFRLEEEAAGRGVRFVHGERFDGPVVPLLAWWLDREFGPRYAALNEALKRRAEDLERAHRRT